eukprot:ANDGO_06267.mRNA.1 putative short-chain type dehydrogenase/reductase VdlC
MSVRVWFVTGCSNGFGLTLSETLLRAGERVFMTARRVDSLASLLAEFPETARCAELDVTSSAQASAAVQKCIDVFGRIDVLLNNAGYGLVGAVEETSDAEMQKNFQANFFGPVYVTQAALPFLRKQAKEVVDANQKPVILFNTAIAALENEAGFGIYGAAKAAQEAVAESLRKELVPVGIRVGTIVLGPFRTGFIGSGLQTTEKKIDDYTNSSGKFAHHLTNVINGRQPGDPEKASKAVLEAVVGAFTGKHQLPHRLILGSFAVAKVDASLAHRKKELDEWRNVGQGCDF